MRRSIGIYSSSLVATFIRWSNVRVAYEIHATYVLLSALSKLLSISIHWAIGIGINNRQRWHLLLLTSVNAGLTDNTVVSTHHPFNKCLLHLWNCENEWNCALRYGGFASDIRLQDHCGLFHESKPDLSYYRSQYYRWSKNRRGWQDQRR